MLTCCGSPYQQIWLKFESLRKNHILNNLMHFVTTTLNIAQLVYNGIQWESSRGAQTFRHNCINITDFSVSDPLKIWSSSNKEQYWQWFVFKVTTFNHIRCKWGSSQNGNAMYWETLISLCTFDCFVCTLIIPNAQQLFSIKSLLS